MPSEKELDYYFGKESLGTTYEERAKNSKQLWVRSQDHLALYKEHRNPTGLIMTSWDVYSIFGLEKMAEAFDKASAIIIRDETEPAGTLIRRREVLGLSKEELARKAKLELADVEDSENIETRTPIRKLEKICNVMNLDIRKLGWIPDALKS